MIFYSSIISQDDANQQACDDTTANAQAYINAPANAACSVSTTPDWECIENLADFMLSRQPSKWQVGFYSTGRLVQELAPGLHQDVLALFKKVLAQKKDSNKVYSLHEPDDPCISEGKQHKKYEFGAKVSIITTQTTCVIIGARNIEKMCTTVKHGNMPWPSSSG